VQKLQNRAARILTSSNYDTNAEYLIEKLSWKNLESQRKIAKAIMVYKSLNGFVPDYLSEMFVDRSSVTNYTLRDTIYTYIYPYIYIYMLNVLTKYLLNNVSHVNFLVCCLVACLISLESLPQL
jgi:hypothetical protein